MDRDTPRYRAAGTCKSRQRSRRPAPRSPADGSGAEIATRLRIADQSCPAERSSSAPSETMVSPAFTPEAISREPSTRAPDFHRRGARSGRFPSRRKRTRRCLRGSRRPPAREFPGADDRRMRIEPNIRGLIRSRPNSAAPRERASVRVAGSTASETTLTRPVQC